MKTGMVDLAVIVVYLILMSAVGVVFKRFNRSSDDFMRSGCRATWWLCGASCFMSIFSAWTFTGGAAVAYEAGWSFSVLFLMNALGFACRGSSSRRGSGSCGRFRFRRSSAAGSTNGRSSSWRGSAS